MGMAAVVVQQVLGVPELVMMSLLLEEAAVVLVPESSVLEMMPGCSVLEMVPGCLVLEMTRFSVVASVVVAVGECALLRAELKERVGQEERKALRQAWKQTT